MPLTKNFHFDPHHNVGDKDWQYALHGAFSPGHHHRVTLDRNSWIDRRRWTVGTRGPYRRINLGGRDNHPKLLLDERVDKWIGIEIPHKGCAIDRCCATPQCDCLTVCGEREIKI